jgi:hypothetical protein
MNLINRIRNTLFFIFYFLDQKDKQRQINTHFVIQFDILFKKKLKICLGSRISFIFAIMKNEY